jgi:hypothetical protein
MHMLLMEVGSKRLEATRDSYHREMMSNPVSYAAPVLGVDLQAGQASKAYCSAGPLVSLAPTCDSQPASILIA